MFPFISCGQQKTKPNSTKHIATCVCACSVSLLPPLLCLLRPVLCIYIYIYSSVHRVQRGSATLTGECVNESCIVVVLRHTHVLVCVHACLHQCAHRHAHTCTCVYSYAYSCHIRPQLKLPCSLFLFSRFDSALAFLGRRSSSGRLPDRSRLTPPAH